MRPNSRPHRQPLVTAPMAGNSTVRDFGRQAPTGFGVRRARSPDAEAAATVLRASISMECAADHGNDPDIVARWLEHKTPLQCSRTSSLRRSRISRADERS